jgi:hypothetical protein
MSHLCVDLVYLWVDGNDDAWKAKKNAELKKIGKLPPTEVIGDCRSNDNDELLFSLRSVEKFAPWINHIFVVTDNQTPKWLDTGNPKITIVDLEEIMPQNALPCFNSTVIELFIPNIRNLSEHFIYANDDMLFTAKTTPSYFFTKKGVPIIRVRKSKKIKLFPVGKTFIEQWESGTIYSRNILNSKKLVYDIAGDYNYHLWPSHNIDTYRKSDMLTSLNIPIIAEKLNGTRKNHFRNENDIHRILFHLLGVAKYGYKAVKNDFFTQLSQFLTFRFRDQPLYVENIKKDMFRISRISRRIRRKLTCVEDPTDENIRKSNRDYLQKIFPNKSEFEK